MEVHSQGQSFPLSQLSLSGDSKGCSHSEKSKEQLGPSKIYFPSVVIDEAEVYDVYLLFVWQFSKVLIKLSKVELIFLYFFFNFLFPIFITMS